MTNNKEKRFFKASSNLMFKAIFCDEKNKDLLKELIYLSLKNSINKDVKDFKMISPELSKNILSEKGKILDVLLESKDEIINIEMNASYYEGLNRRNASYIFSKYSEDTRVSELYTKMKTFIQINFTVGLSKDDELYKIYELTDRKTKDKYIDNLVILEYNINKALQLWKDGNEEYSFLALFEADEEQLNKMAKGSGFVDKVRGEIVRLNKNQRFSEFLTAEEEEAKYKATIKYNAKKEGLEEGRAVGLAEGRASGLEEGRVQGRTEGLAEGLLIGKIDIAKELLKDGMNVQKIAKITQLEVKQIEKLQ